MNKELYTKKLFSLTNLYHDFIENGFKKNHIIPNITFNKKTIEKIKLKKERKKTSINDIKNKRRNIINLAENILNCTKCPLHQRVNKVPGIGNTASRLLVISIPPTRNDEIKQRPLTGELLDFFIKWINAINLKIEDIFITNIIKCPPSNNKIQKEMIEACRIHLDNQISIINPDAILSLGQLTISSLKRSFSDLQKSHGQIFNYNNYPVIPTFHPYNVLKNINLKKLVWNDLKVLKNILEKG